MRHTRTSYDASGWFKVYEDDGSEVDGLRYDSFDQLVEDMKDDKPKLTVIEGDGGGEDDLVGATVHQTLAFIEHHKRNRIRGIAVALVDADGNVFRDASLSDDPFALYTAVGLLFHRINAQVEEASTDDEMPPPAFVG